MKYLIGYLTIFILAVTVSSGTFAQAAEAEDLKQTVDYLLNFVANSDCTFIRNGQTYTPKEAAAHMKTKYDYFTWTIKTPEDFIRLAASKSLLSGQPYLVKTKEGKEFKSADWLGKVLNDYRALQKDSKISAP